MAKFRGSVVECQECFSEFRVPPSRSGKAKYCSKQCADRHRGPERRNVTLLCAACGQGFETFPSHQHRRKYCSRACKEGDIAYRGQKSRRISGSGNPLWNGGRTAHREGYVYCWCPTHPFTTTGYVLEHRLVVESWLRENDPSSTFLVTLGWNRYLSPDYVVHHRDEDRANNALENLEVMTPADHVRRHAEMRRQPL